MKGSLQYAFLFSVATGFESSSFITAKFNYHGFLFSLKAEGTGVFFLNDLKVHQCQCVQWLSCVRLFAAPWTVARQAPLSMGFSRQEYWNEVPFPSPGDLPDPVSPMSPALAGGFFTTSATWEAVTLCMCVCVSCSVIEYWSGLPFPFPGKVTLSLHKGYGSNRKRLSLQCSGFVILEMAPVSTGDVNVWCLQK